MTATMLAQGIVRGVEDRSSRKTGEVFGTEVSVMTEVGDTLGETLKVMVFNAREGDPKPPAFERGQRVGLVVEVEAGTYGLSARFVRVASEADRAAMIVGVPAVVEVESAGARGK